jgi:NHL repeat-containing protein
MYAKKSARAYQHGIPGFASLVEAAHRSQSGCGLQAATAEDPENLMHRPKEFQIVIVTVLAITLAALTGCGSSGASSDPAAGQAQLPALAVADAANNRVLIYNARQLKTDESATVVLGQPDFTHNSPNQGGTAPAANTLAGPRGVVQGPNGEIYVADTFNCRVLRFDPPFTTNMNAAVVFGEPDFTSRECEDSATPATAAAATSSSLAAPVGLALDSHGDLWVSDSFLGCEVLGIRPGCTEFGDSRVVEFVPPFSNDMAASVVIGQPSTAPSLGCNQVFGNEPDFPPPTASSLCGPKGLTFDSAGDLWIADTINDRVLEFVPPFSTGMSASLEVGHPAGANAFTTGMPDQLTCPCLPTVSNLHNPAGVAFDSAGDLWVADANHNRVLEYIPSFSDGMNASTVLGAPDFTTVGALFSFPQGLAFQQDTNDLFVSDTSDNRVLMFTPPFSNDVSPAVVIGQASLTGTQPNQGDTTAAANTLNLPIGVAALH